MSKGKIYINEDHSCFGASPAERGVSCMPAPEEKRAAYLSYAKAVAWAAENGITNGTGNGKFAPNAVCTRAQIVTLLYRADN